MSKTYIELFCGIGGVRCALDRFGWTCVLANDVSPTKCDIYERNYGDAELKHGDVSDITVTSFSGADFNDRVFSLSRLFSSGKEAGFYWTPFKDHYSCFGQITAQLKSPQNDHVGKCSRFIT